MVENDTTAELVDPHFAGANGRSANGAAPPEPVADPVVNSVADTSLRSLVSHNCSFSTDIPLEEAQKFFCNHAMEFAAVLDGGRPLGLCARRQVGMVLGSRFGFSLFARNPVRNYLLPESLIISVADSIPDVLSRVSARKDEYFYDDVILVDESGLYLGCIFVRNLVRLQHGLLLENFLQLEKNNREIERKNLQMEQELNMAGKVQQAMLPQVYPSFPPQSDSSILRFHHRYLPAGRVSGDFFHVRRISDHLAGVFICDVMGHGVRSAMVTAAMRALVDRLQADASHPGELMEHLNQGLFSILRQNDETIYASAVYLLIDTADLEICWASAGHPCPLLLRASDSTIIPLALTKEKRGKALGLMESGTYQTGEATLEPGDRLLLYTDGIYEIFAGEKEFGMEGFLHSIQQFIGLPAPELMDRLLQTARAFGDTHEFEDDVCLLAVDVAPDE